MNQINNMREKAYFYNSKKIPSEHINSDIKKLYKTYNLYMTWGAIQVFYNNNINYFDNNIIDLHGLYQKEVTSVLYIYFNSIRENNQRIKIITGKGSGVVLKITLSTLKQLNLNFKINDNFIIVT